MTERQFLNVHRFLHQEKIRTITVNNTRYEVKTNSASVRYIVIDGVKYIQQNPKQETTWGIAARHGQKITWGIKPGKWDMAVDNEIKVFSS